jgi:hypothetical protein
MRSGDVLVPPSAELRRLLHENTGLFGQFGPHAGALANAADPGSGVVRTVDLGPDVVRGMGDCMAALLEKARADDDPAQAALAELAAQFPA